jgi:N-acyl amino acid synthase of PEP-CTERM/exosortase system
VSLIAPVRPNPARPATIEDRYFQFSTVDGTPDLETTYRIRYQVYCIERGFLPQGSYPARLETDEYDACALHMLARHRAGEPAGTARLVMHSPMGFPILKHCVFTGEHAFLNDPSDPRLLTYGEISRVAISKIFRRRVGDTPYGGPPRTDSSSTGAADVVEFPASKDAPEILLGLLRQIYHECKRRGLTHLMLACERSLYVMMRRLGFLIVPAGPEVDYYGPVRPYVASIQALEEEHRDKYPERLRYMIRGLEPELIPGFARDLDVPRGRRRSLAAA